MCKGELSRALQRLTSQGIASATDEVVEKMRHILKADATTALQSVDWRDRNRALATHLHFGTFVRILRETPKGGSMDSVLGGVRTSATARHSQRTSEGAV